MVAHLVRYLRFLVVNGDHCCDSALGTDQLPSSFHSMFLCSAPRSESDWGAVDGWELQDCVMQAPGIQQMIHTHHTCTDSAGLRNASSWNTTNLSIRKTDMVTDTTGNPSS